MEVTITADGVIKAAGVLTALGGIGSICMEEEIGEMNGPVNFYLGKLEDQEA